ncbi:MAG: DUF1295 domain-containing protein [Spirochaetes bacterium]|nr:DUF1295 domain-containing protein [Spirochaetota bacterium]
MAEQQVYNIAVLAFTAAGVLILIALFFIPAPYGRHLKKSFGFAVNNRTGWLLMEAPASILFIVFLFWGNQHIGIVTVVFLLIWQAHYLYRSFIYPFRLIPRPMPLAVAFMGLFFNIMNTYLQGRWFAVIGPEYAASWLRDPRFIIGLAMFITGFAINKWADNVLHRLKRENPGTYRIPSGGLYNAISSPNYFGEIIEWSGWAVMTWSVPGAVFAFWTAANLMPRAWSHHRWYKRTFPDYPKERKALIPGVW